MDYNTSRTTLILPEYGRNIHQMVAFLKTIEDRKERNEQAKIVVNVMSSLSPKIHNKEELEQHLWTQLLIMADFDLDIDIPVAIPPKEEVLEQPQSISYPQSKIKIRHYGKNIELLIQQVDLQEEEHLKLYVTKILNQMKHFYVLWNKDMVTDDVIKDDFVKLSGKTFDFLDDIQLENISVKNSNKKKKKINKKR